MKSALQPSCRNVFSHFHFHVQQKSNVFPPAMLNFNLRRVILAYELDLYKVTINYHVKYLGQRSLHSLP